MDEALLKLATPISEAVATVLEMFVAEGVEHSQPAEHEPDKPLLGELSMPAVAASAGYAGGVAGGNILAMTRLGARRLAAALMMQDIEECTDDELSELEVSAFGEAMNQTMAAAAQATSQVVGDEVATTSLETHHFASADETESAFELTPHVVVIPFTILGEPCFLILLVPNAFVVRTTKAFADHSEALMPGGLTAAAGDERVDPEIVRRGLVRVWAELGRVRMPVDRAVALGPGEVVDLDTESDDLVSLYVNGSPFGAGRLVLVDGSEWGIRVESVLAETDVEPLL